MNLSASQCGSGCESGWTFYLDQSFCSETGVNGSKFVSEDEEDGLSMVSDASSGPRQYYCQEKTVKKNSRNKKMKEHCGNNQQHSCLDDTASSPLISFPEKSFRKEGSVELSDFSQGFSDSFRVNQHSRKDLVSWNMGKLVANMQVVSRKEVGNDKRVNCNSFCLNYNNCSGK